jgi:N-acetylmuramic acid 6-phosphate etherase
MQAGTAQKAMLNMLSTAIMLRLGRVYQGLMVDMQISNDKLLARAQRMVATIAGCTPDVAADALETAGRDIKAAILIARGATLDAARADLARNHGQLRNVLDGDAASGGEGQA